MDKKIALFFSSIFIAIALFLILQLPWSFSFNGLLDEGHFLYSERLIARGEIPYRDFFMTTTPGSYYIVAFFFKYLGESILVGRILGITAIVLLIMVCGRLFKFRTRWQLLYLASVALLFIRPNWILYYNHAIILSFASLLLLLGNNFLLAGILAGISFTFKQSVGVFTILFLIISIREKKFLIRYLSGVMLIMILFWGYFWINDSLPQAIHYIFVFAGSVKNHRLPFLVHRLLLVPVIIIGLKLFYKSSFRNRFAIFALTSLSLTAYLLLNTDKIGRLFSYLHDPVFYGETLVYLFPLILISLKRYVTHSLGYLAVFLGIAASGYSTDPLWMVSPLLIPIFFMVFNRKKLLKIIFVVTYVFMFSQKSFPSITNNGEVSARESKFISYTSSAAEDLNKVIDFIKSNTDPNENIFCFPYCPGLYFLSNRHGGSYFNLFYFETFRAVDQDKVISDLIKNKVKLVVMQKTGEIETRKELEFARLPKIVKFIEENYGLVFETSNFKVLYRQIAVGGMATKVPIRAEMAAPIIP